MRVDLSARHADAFFLGNAPFRRAPSLPQARDENALLPLIRPTLALKANGALPRAIVILMFSNDAKTRIAAIDVPRGAKK